MILSKLSTPSSFLTPFKSLSDEILIVVTKDFFHPSPLVSKLLPAILESPIVVSNPTPTSFSVLIPELDRGVPYDVDELRVQLQLSSYFYF